MQRSYPAAFAPAGAASFASGCAVVRFLYRKLTTVAGLAAVVVLLALASDRWIVGVGAAPLEDWVQELPGLHPSRGDSPIRTPTPHFSGYLDATAGCDKSENGGYCKLHYWLALAEGPNPENKPVVLWLNGGPGSSSLYGFLQENGPLMMTAEGGLMENPWSWTQVANLVALEAPVGVGYSYCEAQAKGKKCKNTDKNTAKASRAALQHFFQKFPELSSSDFFITGESYGGVYIPTLAKEILDRAPEIRLKGLAVGDPCTDNAAQADSMDSLWYGHKHGLVDDQIFDLLWNQCNARAPTVLSMGGVHWVAGHWNEHLKAKRGELGDEAELRSYSRRLLETLIWDAAGDRVTMSDECTLAYRKFLMATSHGLSQSWRDLYIDDYSLFAPVTSKEDDDLFAYMSRPDVRKALHVEEAPTSQWPYADVGFDYTKQYDACNPRPEEGAPSMIAFYQDVVPRLEITYVYNGDTDPCVSYEGTRTAVKRFGFDELDGGSQRPWFYNMTGAPLDVMATKSPLFGPNLVAQNMGAQLGGEVISYESGLSFLTVHGSGHMVPQFRPQAALHMLDRLVHYADLSPLYPGNETLAKMSDELFHKVMDKWTETAKGQPYVTRAVWDRSSKGDAERVSE